MVSMAGYLTALPLRFNHVTSTKEVYSRRHGATQ
jgi:hypothetical protein